MSQQETVLEAALRYADRGWRLIPVSTPHRVGDRTVCSCHRGAGCDKPGKHTLVKDWQSRATSDRRQIQEWWTLWPNANVGLLLTPESRLVAIDVDNHIGGSSGSESLATLIATHGPLPPTLEVRSGGGGIHLYYSLPESLNLRKANGRIAEGIEYFTRRFMVLPPSLHVSGLQYEWVNEDQEVAQAPDWIIGRMMVGAIHESGDRERDMSERQLKHGERNTGLFNMGRVLRNDGSDQSEVRERLRELNYTVCEAPLVETEIEGIVKGLFSPSGVSWVNPVFYYEWHIKNYLSDPRMHFLRDYHVGWHARFIANAFLGGGRLPADKDVLFSMSKASDKALFEKEYEKTLLDFALIEIEGEWYYVNEELESAHWKAQEKSRTNKINGSKGGRANGKTDNAPATIGNE
jgi:Bifunctional DNA primase/polymerase, N-terminal/Primase C terminal 1 (PriCT-1)